MIWLGALSSPGGHKFKQGFSPSNFCSSFFMAKKKKSFPFGKGSPATWQMFNLSFTTFLYNNSNRIWKNWNLFFLSWCRPEKKCQMLEEEEVKNLCPNWLLMTFVPVFHWKKVFFWVLPPWRCRGGTIFLTDSLSLLLKRGNSVLLPFFHCCGRGMSQWKPKKITRVRPRSWLFKSVFPTELCCVLLIQTGYFS